VAVLAMIMVLPLAVLQAPTAPAMARQSWSSWAADNQPRVTTHRMGPANDRRVIATSVDGTPIVARHYGALDAPVQLVIIGQMHGSEPGGRRVARELGHRKVPDGVGVWVIVTMNPDGDRRGTRANAHGVDLNRNFPAGWQGARSGVYYPGPRAASEPETRGMVRFLTAVQPAAVLSFHQAFDLVDISHPRSRAAGRQLAAWMGERAAIVRCSGPCHGTMTQWIDAALKTVAITVELDHRVSGAEARRAATAVLRLGTWLGR
jgi:hypothetical protein